MKRLFAWAAAIAVTAAALTSATVAAAEKKGKESASQAKNRPQVTPEQAWGSITGTVSKVDPNKGQLTITNKGRNSTLFGTPDQVASFKQGQQVTIDFVDYNGQHWIDLESMGAGGTGQGEPRATEQASGEITDIDKANGTFSVAGRDYRSRPEYLAGVEQGDQVSLQYSEIKGNNWAFEVNPMGETGVGGSGAGGTGAKQGKNKSKNDAKKRQ